MVLILAVGVASVFLLHRFGRPSDRPTELVQDAHALADSGQWEKAALAYENAARAYEAGKNPQQAQVVWALAANAAQRIPDLQRAETCLLRAEAVAPKSAGQVRLSLRSLRDHGHF